MRYFNSTSIKMITMLFALIAVVGFGSHQAYADRVEKVSICHIPPGNPDNMHTISVGEPAVDAHLAHGDMLGSCVGESEDHAEAEEDEESHESEESEELVGSPIPAPVKAYSMRSIYGK